MDPKEVADRSGMPLDSILYSEQLPSWPSSGNHILANYDDNSIVVYQAYNHKIADAALKYKNFHSAKCLASGYNPNRMSWIKTNFLWIMYRSGWATKPNQERILAIRITRNGFEEILSRAVASSKPPPQQAKDWDKAVKSSDVVLQWDPDHLPNGEKTAKCDGRRAVQLGMRGNTLKEFSESFVLDIMDLTAFTEEQRLKSPDFTDTSALLVPVEKVYVPKDAHIIQQIHLSV